MKNMRKLPIVGDVHLGRDQWPETPEDFLNIWQTRPLPLRLSKIIYQVNAAK